MNRKTLAGLIFLLGLQATYAEQSIFKMQLPEIAKKLGWVNDPNAKNLCKGYYQEPNITYKKFKNSKLVDYHADQFNMSKSGLSELIGHVVLTQTGKQIHADKLEVYRDPKTNKIKQFKLQGNITYHEPNTAVYAQNANFELHQQAWHLSNVLYRLLAPKSHSSYVTEHNQVTKSGNRRIYQLSAWGRAQAFKQDKKKIWDVYNATYTTCAPNCHVWHIKAGHIHINKNTNIGSAKNVKLYVRGVPVFWFPYLSFSLNNQRKSGFLAPTYGTSTSLGANLRLPYYWNIAPNFDTVITPSYSAKRGSYFTNKFRYLTHSSSGNIFLQFIPNDLKFKSFINKLKQEYSGNPQAAKQLSELKGDSASRSYISWQDQTQFNQHLFASVNYAHVSDDYLMEDFFYGPNADPATANQLQQQATFDYYAKQWHASAQFERYQTLHPLNQANTINQYAKLPQITYNGLSSYRPYGFQFSLDGNFTNYNKNKDPYNFNIESPTVGDKIDLRPGIAWPKHNQFFFFKPELQMDLTAYSLNRPNPGAPSDPARSLPIFDIYSGMYFDRNVTLFGNHYTQSFEPQIYYLFVPFHNQNNLPMFDTVDNSVPLSFNYDQMFSTNRFSNSDRIGDANQITLAATTRFREAATGAVKASASIGEIIYFRNRRVLACTDSNTNNPNDPKCNGVIPENNKQRTSPIAGQVTYNINQFWHVTGDLVYNGEAKSVDNQTLSLSYAPDYKRVLNVSYTYARNGDIDDSAPVNSERANLEQATLSGAWPINEKWEALGQLNYSISRHDFQSYLYGLEYDSCCWAFRAVANRVFVGLNPGFDNQYDTRYYLQFSLKGLTDLGTRDPSAVLSQYIKGYNNYFGEEY